MRITFLSPVADTSGGSRVIHIYAEKLRARGHDVHLFTRRPEARTLQDRLRSLLKGRGWPARLPQIPSHFDPACYTMTTLAPHRPITADDVPDADVIIATWWETAEWMQAMPAAKGRRIHFVQHYEVFAPFLKPRVDAVLAAPTFKITISRWLDDLLRDGFGNTEVALIFNSVDTDQFHAPPRGRQPRPTIGMLYSTIPWKDSRSGFAAFELLRQKLPDAELICFGAYPADPSVPLPEGVRLHVQPPQDRIRDLYAACDIWLCPSTAEGFHLPPLEAMACRTPVVSTPVGGPMDILVEGRNGYFVPIGDPVAMAERLEAVFALPDSEWRRLSDGAYRTATDYTWDDAATKFEAAIHRALQA